MLTDKTAIRTVFLHLLAHLLLREGKRMVSGNGPTLRLARLLDTDKTKEEGTEILHEATSIRNEESALKFEGEELYRVLDGVYDNDKQTKEGSYMEERKFVVLALRNLLCISHKAKETAIKG